MQVLPTLRSEPAQAAAGDVDRHPRRGFRNDVRYAEAMPEVEQAWADHPAPKDRANHEHVDADPVPTPEPVTDEFLTVRKLMRVTQDQNRVRAQV